MKMVWLAVLAVFPSVETQVVVSWASLQCPRDWKSDALDVALTA